MIDYETYCKIRLDHQEHDLSFGQIARKLGLDPETVAKYARATSFPRRISVKRTSKLDALKPTINRWLARSASVTGERSGLVSTATPVRK